jgi:hypothetical protein
MKTHLRRQTSNRQMAGVYVKIETSKHLSTTMECAWAVVNQARSEVVEEGRAPNIPYALIAAVGSIQTSDGTGQLVTIHFMQTSWSGTGECRVVRSHCLMPFDAFGVHHALSVTRHLTDTAG